MKLLQLTSLGLAFLALAGCTSTVNTVERADPVGTPATINDRRILTDKSLTKAVSVVQVNEGVASGNLARIQVVLRSNKKKAITVNYVFEWYDMNGMLVTTASGGWEPLRLMGMEERAISSIAPSPNAVDFVLKLQEAK
jgi:uncharacterized protein YcfL